MTYTEQYMIEHDGDDLPEVDSARRDKAVADCLALGADACKAIVAKAVKELPHGQVYRWSKPGSAASLNWLTWLAVVDTLIAEGY